MNENEFEGKKKQVSGAVKKAVGKVTGDTGKQISGSVKKAVGEIQESVGQKQERDKKKNEYK